MNVSKKKPIRSFVRREGRITPSQKQALEQLWPEYGLELTNNPINFDAVFKRKAERILEIGFGMGGSLLQMAIDSPDKDFIGIEVHRPGVGALFKELREQSISNIKVFVEDAVTVLKQCIENESLSKVQIFFPDPWPKKRHHKRRLIQPELVRLIVTKLKPGGQLHLATDWKPYAEHMMEVLSANSDLLNVADDNCFITGDSLRPQTKFENRGRRLGHGIWDLLFTRKTYFLCFKCLNIYN